MSRKHFGDFSPDEDEFSEFWGTDAADQAFWDEFWEREASKQDENPLVTVTVRNEETGEEKIIEKVRLRFRNLRRIRG